MPFALHDRHQSAVGQHRHLQRQRPPPVHVRPGEQQAALQHREKHVQEPDQVPAGGLHRVVPERVDDRPGEIVAMVAPRHFGEPARKTDLPPEEQPAARILHQQHPDQHHHHRPERTPDGDVLRQPVVPEMGLRQVQHDEEPVHPQGQVVRGALRGAVTRPAAAGGALRVGDQRPERHLVQQVEAPRRHPAGRGRLDQLPVIPGRTGVGGVRNVSQPPSRAAR